MRIPAAKLPHGEVLGDALLHVVETGVTNDIFTREERIRSLAFMRSALNIGFSIGALLGGLALATNSDAVIRFVPVVAAAIAGGVEVDPAVRQARVDAVIARFNQFNYVGALLGAVLTGLVGSGSLRVGFAVPMVLILGILPLARAFAGPGPVSAPRPSGVGSAS